MAWPFECSRGHDNVYMTWSRVPSITNIGGANEWPESLKIMQLVIEEIEWQNFELYEATKLNARKTS